MKVKSYPHSMTYNRVDKEKNAGHSIIVPNGMVREGKGPNDSPTGKKSIFFVSRNVEKEVLFWTGIGKR